jgi:uncharacterized Zn-finger protein
VLRVVAWLQPRILKSEKEATRVFAVDVHRFVSHKNEVAESSLHHPRVFLPL